METQTEIWWSQINIEIRGAQKPGEANQPSSFLDRQVLEQT